MTARNRKNPHQNTVDATITLKKRHKSAINIHKRM